MADEPLKVLASRTNQAILNLLAVEPTYPRKIGDLLTLSETEVARRLRQMEALGFVAGTWSHIGKNVKLYKLLTNAVAFRFTPEGLRMELSQGQPNAPKPVVLFPFTPTPPNPLEFIGREKELKLLHGPEPVAIVVGMPGIGKTSLVARYAHEATHSRAVFWHGFRGVESFNWLANRLAVFMAQHGRRDLLEAVERGAEIADRQDLMISCMDDARFAVVLDDLQTVEDEAVRTFLTEAIGRIRKGKLVLSGREAPRYAPNASNVRLLHLEGLGDDDVRRFLELKKVSVPAALLPKIREEVGGHPLALNLLLEAASEAKVPVEKLLDRIPERNLEDYLLQEIYNGLSEDEKRVLATASVFRTRFTSEDLASISDKRFEDTLLKLRRRLLVEFQNEESMLHEVIRNFFYTHLEDKKRLHEKAAAHYLARGTVEGRLEAMHHYLAAGRKDRVLNLLEENLDLNDFNFIDGGYQNLYLSVLELFDRKEVTDGRRWALIEDEKGDIRFHRQEYERALALYDSAEAFFGKVNDRGRLADLAWKRGLALMRLGRSAEALTSCRNGLKLAPEEGQTRTRLEELEAGLAKAKAAPVSVARKVVRKKA